MNTTTRWVKMLIAAIITGAANAGLAALGVTAANVAGAAIPPLDWKQLGVMCLSGGLIGMLAYLKQSPVPPDDGEDGGDPLIKPKVVPLLFLLVLPVAMLGAGCHTPKLEPGGVYAPTNSTGVVYNDLGLALADASYKFAYESVTALLRFERDNRAAIWEVTPEVKRALDRVRPEVVAIDRRWALARAAYRANPTPAGLGTLQTILSEIQRVAGAAQAQLDPVYHQLTQPNPNP